MSVSTLPPGRADELVRELRAVEDGYGEHGEEKPTEAALRAAESILRSAKAAEADAYPNGVGGVFLNFRAKDASLNLEVPADGGPVELFLSVPEWEGAKLSIHTVFLTLGGLDQN